MPERPDLDYGLPILDRELRGACVSSVLLKKPPVLRLALEGTLEDALHGATIRSIRRRLHFAHFDLDSPNNIELIIAPMLAGTLAVHEKVGGKYTGSKRGHAFSLFFEDGRELRYRDDVTMGKVYVIPHGKYELVPGFQAVGIDVLDAKRFTFAAFEKIAKKRRDQVKVFLLDKSALDSLGNAYADEVLFAAGIHPKTFVRSLDTDDLKRLHQAISEVLRAAAKEISTRKPATDEKLRDFLKVRNRHKEPCPSCGAAIRKAGVRGYDAFFCPNCQPETRKSGIVSWKR